MVNFTGGDESRVNTYTFDDQLDSAVTTLTNGGWVVTWTSYEQDGWDYGVYSQAYNADGSKNGAETLVNTTTDRAQAETSVAALPDGGWVVAWSSNTQDGDGYGIFSQRFNADGTKNGDETAVNTFTSGWQIQANVAVLSGGGWVITWISGNAQDGSGYGVYSQAYESDGTESGGETRVNTSTVGDQVAPATIALSNGGWVVTWSSSDGTVGSTRDVYTQAFNADGTKNGGETLVNTTMTNDEDLPAIAALGDGGWVVTWMSTATTGAGVGVFAQVYNADGTKDGSEVAVSSSFSGGGNMISVAALSDGGWVAAWSSVGEGDAVSDVYTQAFDASGAKIGDAVFVNTYTTYDQARPSITGIADGGYVVTWTSYNEDGSGGGIYTRTFERQNEPTGTDKTVTLSEDGSYSFQASDFGYADADGDALTSVQIVGLPANGTLKLNGVTVTAGQDIAAADISKLAWTPAANANGKGLANFTFKVTDNSGLTSVAANKITFNVSAVSDAPTGANKTITLAEDSSYTFKASDFGFADVDGDSLSAVTITTLPTGELKLNGVAVTAGQQVVAADIAKLVWTPAANANGTNLSSFTFQVIDDNPQGTGQPSGTSTIVSGFQVTGGSGATSVMGPDRTTDQTSFILVSNVISPNATIETVAADQPDMVTTSGASYHLTFDKLSVIGWPDVPGTVKVYAGTTLIGTASFAAMAGPSSNQVTLDTSAVAAGDAGKPLKIVWAATGGGHGDGLAIDNVVLTRNGGDGTNLVKNGTFGSGNYYTGGAIDASPNTITFDVTAVNDAPTAASMVISLQEDGSYTFKASDFGYADADGDALASVQIVSLPANGSLKLNGVAVTANQTIAAADLSKLAWTPAANANGNGLANVTFKVKDAGGVSSASAYTITFNVTAVNDAPTAANKTVSLNEDASYTFKASDFGYADVEGDALASVQIISLPANGSLTLNGVAVTANQSIAAADLTKLAWTPAANANGNGLANFTFKVKDAGGVASVSANTITFNVVAVNEAPTAASKTISLQEDGSYTFKASDFGYADADSDTLASVQIISLPANGSLKLNGVAVTANQNIAAADLTKLAWTPAANANGNGLANFTFKVKDSGGLSSASANTITFNVASVSDAPTGADKTVTLVEDGAYTFTASDFGFADADGDKMSAVKISTLPTGALKLNGVAVTAGQEIKAADIGKLVWTPLANFNGAAAASLTFQVIDDSQAGAGKETSTSAIVSGFKVTGGAGTIEVKAPNIVKDQTSFIMVQNVVGPNAAFETVAADQPDAVTVSGAQYTLSFDKLSVVGWPDAPGKVTIYAGTTQIGTKTLPTSNVANSQEVTLTTSAIAAADAGKAIKIVWSSTGGGNGNAIAIDNVELIKVGSDGKNLIKNGDFGSGKYYTGEVDATPNKITFNVTSVSDAPTGADKTVTIKEDMPYTFSASDFGFSDVDGDTLSAVKISSLPTGALKLNGVAVSAGQEIKAADIGKLVWTPAANAYGDKLSSFTFQVIDSSTVTVKETSTSAIVSGFKVTGGVGTIEVKAPNIVKDQTSFIMVQNVVGPNAAFETVAADQPDAVTVSGAQYTLSFDKLSVVGWPDAPGKVTIYAGTTQIGTKTLPTSNVANSQEVTLTTSAIAAADAGKAIKIVWSSTGGGNGNAIAIDNVELIKVGSDGKNLIKNGDFGSGNYSTGANIDLTPNKITFDVDPVNDAPSGADKTVTLLEDGKYTFASSDFGFADVDGNALLGVKISTLPANGKLTLNGVAVTSGQQVAAADISKLVWTPAANANGDKLATVKFQVVDNGGTANGGINTDQSPNTITFNVTPVKEPPSGADKTVTIAEDVSYKFAASDFGFTDPDGGKLSGVKITTLPSDGSLTLAGVAVKAGAIIGAADIPKLAWTPEENDAGKALGKFTFQVISTGTGATMDLTPNTFTINVNEETDFFQGTSKANTLVGTAFADWIDGKAGNDTLTGKGGADTFFFKTGYDKDTITDFVATGTGHDVLSLVGALSITSFADLKANHMVAKGSDVWIDAGQDDVVILKGVKLADLDAGDFLF